MPSKTPTHKAVSINGETHRKLAVLCRMDVRGFSHQMEWLVDRELDRRGIDRRTLRPVVAPAECARTEAGTEIIPPV